MVGNDLISESEIAWVEPIRSGLMNGISLAVTSTDCCTRSISSSKLRSRCSPRATVMSLRDSILKPLIFAVTV